MEITFTALADHANVTQEGKLNVLGIFDRIHARQFPTRHPVLVFAFRTRFEYEDQGQTRKLQIRLLDQDGAVLFNLQGQVEVGPMEPGGFHHTNVVLELRDTEFKAPGRYRFRIELEGAESPHDTVFEVVEAKQS